MRYIDNGKSASEKRASDEAVCIWLRDALTSDVVAIRWQSGFFEEGVLGLLRPTLAQLADKDLDATVLIGSNNCETKASAVRKLAGFLQLPRSRGNLGIVHYANCFYHPKTIHIRYGEGREVAYVGSANLTSQGINGLNIEAGIALDTSQGDSEDVLKAVKEIVDDWFKLAPDGLFVVDNLGDVDDLEQRGILKESGVPDHSDVGSATNTVGEVAWRHHKHHLPPLPNIGGEEGGEGKGKAVLEGDVLIAELAGPGRWSQAAFPEWFIHNFFEVGPDDGLLHLIPVTRTDVGPEDRVACGYKKSKNWYYELQLASSIGQYPGDGQRPIGVFHRIASQTCRYTIVMPGDVTYPDISRCLEENLHRLKRPEKELPRTIMPALALCDSWNEDWFFDR